MAPRTILITGAAGNLGGNQRLRCFAKTRFISQKKTPMACPHALDKL